MKEISFLFIGIIIGAIITQRSVAAKAAQDKLDTVIKELNRRSTAQ